MQAPAYEYHILFWQVCVHILIAQFLPPTAHRSSLNFSPAPFVFSLLPLGVTTYPDPLIILELMSGGSLHDALHPNSRPEPSVCWRLSKDIARGLQFLHTREPPMVHRDLVSTALNLLIYGSTDHAYFFTHHVPPYRA